jgi:hypothetical protein
MSGLIFDSQEKAAAYGVAVDKHAGYTKTGGRLLFECREGIPVGAGCLWESLGEEGQSKWEFLASELDRLYGEGAAKRLHEFMFAEDVASMQATAEARRNP